MKTVSLIKSPRRDKKWRVFFENSGQHVDFGQKGYSDYTIHKDQDRMKRYVKRHAMMHERWGKIGMYSAGFWARWLLWSKPSLIEARRYIETKFDIKIKVK